MIQTLSSIYNIKIKSLQGTPIDFGAFKGKYILIVNVASACGFTSQYKELQELYEKYGSVLHIFGVPCNQFGNQESGSSKEIEEFCEVNFGVTFVLTEKVDVKGPDQHPLYDWLTRKELNGKKNSSVKWNFQKYLIDTEGNLIDYFYSTTKPSSKKITKHLK
jgi:glutathione peroxidase